VVVSKKVKLEVNIEVDVPIDIVENEQRLNAIEGGLVKSISKALYEQGVSFNITKVNFQK
jgi:hypothetical protein